MEFRAGRGRERFVASLSGAAVSPPLTGLTFVDPALLGGGDPAATFAGACERARADVAFVPSWEPWAAGAVRLLREAGVAALWVAPGVLWPALESVGVASGLRAAALEPQALGGPLDAAMDAALTEVARGVHAGAHALVVADDLAGAAGPMVDPAFLRAAVLPRLAALTALAEDEGLPALLHTDGDVRDLMAAIASYGFCGVHGDAAGGRLLTEWVAAARAAGLVPIGGLPTPALADSDGASRAAAHARALALSDGLIVTDDGGLTTAAEARALLGALAGLHGA